MTENFELSIITGSRAMSGSEARRCRKVVMALSESSRPSVHIHVEDVGAPGDLVARHLDGALVVSFGHQPREASRSGDVGALADHDEVRFGVDGQRLEAAHAGPRGKGGAGVGPDAGDGVGDGPDVVGCRAAAATGGVSHPRRANSPSTAAVRSGVSS